MSQTVTDRSKDLLGSGDDPSAIPTWYGGAIFAVILLFSVYLLVYLSDMEKLNVFDRSIQAESRWLHQVKNKQGQQLETYTWTDIDNNRVSIPLEQGREKVLKRYGNSEQ